LLQNTEWDQYEVIQKIILKDAPCSLQSCQSIKEVGVATDTIKDFDRSSMYGSLSENVSL
jgi:hypothetical protein